MSTIVSLLHVLINNDDIIMPKLEELMASVADLINTQNQQTTLLQEIASDTANLLTTEQQMADQIKALQDQINSGGGVSATDLDQVLATMQQQISTMQSIASSVPAPTPPTP